MTLIFLMVYSLYLIFKSISMKKLKKISFIIISLFALIAVSIFGYTKYKKPSYDGEVALQNISKNSVISAYS